MQNTMVKMTTKDGTSFYTTCPTENVDKLIDLFKDAPNFAAAERFEHNSMELTDLPADVQDEVKRLLTIYAKAHVVYEHCKFEATAHYCVKASYGHDRFWCGEYWADAVYTKEERRQHLAELNSYEFPEWAW